MAIGLGIKNHAEVLKQLNSGLYKNTLPDKFVTFISGALTEQTFKYVNAGHETPLLFSGGEIRGVNRNLKVKGTNNTVLGALPGINYEAFSVHLKKGDIIFLYSDGLAESLEVPLNRKKLEKLLKKHIPISGAGRFLGERRSRREGMVSLGKIIKESHELTSEKISNKIHDFLKQYTKKDDQTTIVIKKIA